MELVKKLAKIQQLLKAPKNQDNTFAKFKYRSSEDILEAVKPLLDELVLTTSDEMVMLGDRFYIKATAKIDSGKEAIEAYGWARECLTKKGMDEAQITGSVSSYARKYALNGLFCIDDNKDPDSQDNSKKEDETIDLAKVAKDCGWTVQEVLESFSPTLKSLQDVEDKKSCIEFLKNNKAK